MMDVAIRVVHIGTLWLSLTESRLYQVASFSAPLRYGPCQFGNPSEPLQLYPASKPEALS